MTDEYEWLPPGWDAVPEPRSYRRVQYKRPDAGAVVTQSSIDGMWAVVLRGGHQSPRFPSVREAVHAAEQLVGYPHAEPGWDAHHDRGNVRVAFVRDSVAAWLDKNDARRWWFGVAPAAQHSERYLALPVSAAGHRVFGSLGDRPTFAAALGAALGELRAGPPAMPGDFDRAYALLRDVPDTRPGFVFPQDPVTRVDVELRAGLHASRPGVSYGVASMEVRGEIRVGDAVVATPDGGVRRAGPRDAQLVGYVVRVSS